MERQVHPGVQGSREAVLSVYHGDHVGLPSLLAEVPHRFRLVV